MANNYLQFSFVVPLNCEELAAWVEGLLSQEDSPLEELDNDYRVAFCDPDYDHEDGLGFCWKLDGTDLHIWAEEYGNTEQVTSLLQELVSHELSDVHLVTFSYACWCSRLCPGEFGGGAVSVRWDTEQRRSVVRYIDTFEWVALEE